MGERKRVTMMEQQNWSDMRKIICKKEVREATGLSDTTIWRLEQQGLFPKRIQLSANRTGWFENEVIEWQESRPRGIENRIIPQKSGVC